MSQTNPIRLDKKQSYSVQEVEKLLGVGRQSVYNLIKNGCFKAVLVENRFRIIKSSFDSWLDAEE